MSSLIITLHYSVNLLKTLPSFTIPASIKERDAQLRAGISSQGSVDREIVRCFEHVRVIARPKDLPLRPLPLQVTSDILSCSRCRLTEDTSG